MRRHDIVCRYTCHTARTRTDHRPKFLASRQRPAPPSTSGVRPHWRRLGDIGPGHASQRPPPNETSLPVEAHHHHEFAFNSIDYRRRSPPQSNHRSGEMGGYIPSNALPHVTFIRRHPRSKPPTEPKFTDTLTIGLRQLEGSRHRFRCIGVGELRGAPVQTIDGKADRTSRVTVRARLGPSVRSAMASSRIAVFG